jgi:transposase-like protein
MLVQMPSLARAAMKGDAFPLDGQVEVDETYVGGKNYNRHANKRVKGTGGFTGKVAVVGAIARKGMVVAKTIENTDAATLDGFVHQTVGDNVSLIATDEHPSYQHLKRGGYPHETVRRSEGEYVRGEVHTAHIDSFWSLLKRGIMGSFHHVKKDYLPLYLNEFSYRHNNRKNPDAFADLVTTCGR